MITDTIFFTNELGYTLLNRFKKTLKHVQYFDVVVGYFRTSTLESEIDQMVYKLYGLMEEEIATVKNRRI